MKLNKDKFLIAFEKSGGNISVACKKCGIARSTYYETKKQDENFNQAISDARETVIDSVENALMTNIKNGNITAIIFFLKTRGKRRGYSEKPIYDDKESEPVILVLPNNSRHPPTTKKLKLQKIEQLKQEIAEMEQG